jgi:PAS domain-containing protein
MVNNLQPAYQIDSKWRIIAANEAFCRMLRCTEAGLMGRDVRDLLRHDWRLDFRTYVTRALVGIGEFDVTLPLVAPCGEEGWYKHNLEPLMEDGGLAGYRATVTPHVVHAAAPPKRRWDWRAPAMMWDLQAEHQLAQAG